MNLANESGRSGCDINCRLGSGRVAGVSHRTVVEREDVVGVEEFQDGGASRVGGMSAPNGAFSIEVAT